MFTVPVEHENGEPSMLNLTRIFTVYTVLRIFTVYTVLRSISLVYTALSDHITTLYNLLFLSDYPIPDLTISFIPFRDTT